MFAVVYTTITTQSKKIMKYQYICFTSEYSKKLMVPFFKWLNIVNNSRNSLHDFNPFCHGPLVRFVINVTFTFNKSFLRRYSLIIKTTNSKTQITHSIVPKTNNNYILYVCEHNWLIRPLSMLRGCGQHYILCTHSRRTNNDYGLR